MVGGQTKPKIEGVGGASYTSGNIGQVLITFFFCFAYDYVGNTEITERLVMVVQLGNPQYQAAQIHCKSTQMVVSSYL